MNLHRSSKTPDWKKIHPSTYKFFQKVAAATNGVVTPGNCLTVIGLAMVLYGLYALLNEHYWLGLLFLAVGRLLDVFDGAVAEVTRTKSSLGELFDAVADKIGTLLTIIVLFIIGITPWWVIVALVVPQACISLVIAYKKKKGAEVHPTLQGKLSMATAWTGIVALLADQALDGALAISLVGYALVIASLVLGLIALWQYSTGRD